MPLPKTTMPEKTMQETFADLIRARHIEPADLAQLVRDFAEERDYLVTHEDDDFRDKPYLDTIMLRKAIIPDAPGDSLLYVHYKWGKNGWSSVKVTVNDYSENRAVHSIVNQLYSFYGLK
jgi:hypothetical protein